MQTVRDQTTGALKKLSVFFAKGIQLVTVRIKHTENVTVLVPHRHDDFGTSCVKRRQIPHIFVHVAYDDRLARLQRSAAQSLFNRETRVRRRLVAGVGKNHKFVFDDFVNCYPTVIARRANHFHQLLHSFSRAAASQRKSPDLLQLLASGFLHSRDSNLAQKETKRECDFNFL